MLAFKFYIGAVAARTTYSSSSSSSEGLLLSPFIARGDISAARALSRVSSANLTGHAGYIATAAAGMDQIFFWLHGARNPRQETCVPLILWLQGGPGVSGQVGSFNEMGPQYLQQGSGATTTARNRTWTWNERYAMVFIDQPVETGFSYTTTRPKQYTLTSDAAAQALYAVLVQFFKLFPEYACSPFYVMGESYGGHYVPHTSWWIHKMNAEVGRTSTAWINLKGLAIGNPDLDMAAQMPPIADMLYNHALIDVQEREFTRKLHEEVVALQDSDPVKSFELWNSYWGDCCPCPGCPANGSYIFKTLTGNDDPLDMRTTSMPDDWSLVSGYMNSDAVRSALHAVPGRKWVEQNNVVYMAMSNSGDAQNASAPLLPTLMAHYDVLLYAGQMDATLGPISLAAAVDKVMAMEGAAAQWAPAWKAAPKTTWRVTDYASERLTQLELMGAESADLCGQVHAVAGYAHSIATSKSTNFTVATVLNAGHLAPGNQPVSALDMVTRFVEGYSF
jgi:vitellogenic carboxypeptidase-like protein